MSGAIVPSRLSTDGDSLHITWSDGVEHRLSWQVLRKACPCANCRADRESPPQSAGEEPESSGALGALPVISIAEAQPLRATGVRPVGNYAYAIQFSDGHTTGIYSLTYLRQLGEAAARAAADAAR